MKNVITYRQDLLGETFGFSGKNEPKGEKTVDFPGGLLYTEGGRTTREKRGKGLKKYDSGKTGNRTDFCRLRMDLL